ncbi:MAG: hypothetical protein COA86_15085 [Kangiella sp.]|nr:MAG: hypothetical protein COA86_15085 [Kangiella sp.]
MDMNTFYDLDENAIGMFSCGVAWTKPERVRLGSYDIHIDPGYIYNNENEKIAVFDAGVVSDLKGNLIGEYRDRFIYINNEVVGSYIASDHAAAASVVFLFGKEW